MKWIEFMRKEDKFLKKKKRSNGVNEISSDECRKQKR